MPHFSIIVVSHNKPKFVMEAVQSLLNQTHSDWEGVLVDSGVLYNQGFFKDLKDPRLKVVPSGETRELARTKNMNSWCFNKWLNSGELKGELIKYLNDDDLLYPSAFETFWSYYTGHNREPQAMYASQDIGVVDSTGQTRIIGRRLADRPAGKFCKGRKLDCQVDYLQFCHTAKLLDKYREEFQTNEFHIEDRLQSLHADGIFLEQMGEIARVHNINQVLSMNRRTVDSVNIQHTESLVRQLLHRARGTWSNIRYAWKRRTRARKPTA